MNSVRSRSTVLRLTVVATLALSIGVGGSQTLPNSSLASFDAAWQTIEETYYDPTFGGLDWAGVRAELRPRAEAASSPDGVRAVIREMLGRLKQSHFVLLSSSAEDALPGDATVEIEVRVNGSGVVVTQVAPASDAYKTGVRAGDRLVSLDGQDIAEWVAQSGGGDDRAGRLAVWQRVFRGLHGPGGSSADLALVDPVGRLRRLRVPRSRDEGETVTLGNLPPLRVRTSATSLRTRAGRRVGAIAFSAWMAAVSEPVAAAVDAFRGADGIVLDLRGNPGGIAEMIRGISGHFLGTPELIGRAHLRGATLEFRANPRRSTSDGRRVEPFAGPLALLVDELTASASECLAGGLQSLGRARVFGTQTMGQALPASTRRLPSGDVLMFAVGDFVTSTGRRLEGDGVVPDEVVPLSIEALAEGRDPALDAALAWIDRQSSGRPGPPESR